MTRRAQETLFDDYRTRIEAALEQVLPAPNTLPARLHEAMRYAVLGGGKRIRPVLVYATGHAVGAATAELDRPATAVELIHAYSLVHDDLPAMDDDELRRGRPTCHRAYDEATAILVGDALQALAFRVLASDGRGIEQPQVRLKLIEILANAAGSRGMAGGQALDLQAVGKRLDLAELEMMHIHKTGALIRASVLMGAHCKPGLDEGLVESLDHYAKCLGLAFQIRDDVLDVIGSTDRLGKPQGSDAAADKPTYVSVLGLNEARQQARRLHEDAVASLDDFGERGEPLRRLSSRLLERLE